MGRNILAMSFWWLHGFGYQLHSNHVRLGLLALGNIQTANGLEMILLDFPKIGHIDNVKPGSRMRSISPYKRLTIVLRLFLWKLSSRTRLRHALWGWPWMNRLLTHLYKRASTLHSLMSTGIRMFIPMPTVYNKLYVRLFGKTRRRSNLSKRKRPWRQPLGRWSVRKER